MAAEATGAAVFAAALATALATGLGAAPFAFVARLARSWLGVANALAAGFMVAASGLLFYEGVRADTALTFSGGDRRCPVRGRGVPPTRGEAGSSL